MHTPVLPNHDDPYRSTRRTRFDQVVAAGASAFLGVAFFADAAFFGAAAFFVGVFFGALVAAGFVFVTRPDLVFPRTFFSSTMAGA